MSEIKWIKITTDIFDDEKIKLIDSMPERDTILVIWMKLLTLAGKSNKSGYLLFSDNIPYNEEMLSTVFNRPLNSVRLAIATFKKFKMISVENSPENLEEEILYITNWEKHQNTDQMEFIREQTRLRVQRFRAKNQLENKSVTECSVTRNVTVTECNATDKDKEEDKDKNKNIKEKEKYKKEKEIPPFPPRGESPIFDSEKEVIEILNYLNLKTNKNFSYKNKNNLQNIKARLKEGFTVEQLMSVVDKKTEEWLNDKKMNEFLNPETLFRPSKFEKYLNQKVPGQEVKSVNDEYYKNMPVRVINTDTGEETKNEEKGKSPPIYAGS